MSADGVSRNDFRAASGLTRWSAVLDGLDPDGSPALPPGPGLARAIRSGGEAVITKPRRLAGPGRAPGSALVGAAAVMLGLLAVGLFVVSLAAQYQYVLGVKHQSLPSAIEAVGLDAGMTVFSLLALGLAMVGQTARIERALIVVCAAASAAQNYAAADITSPRSAAAYTTPPLFLALVVDRVIAVARRHVLGDAERSVWAAVGRAAAAAARALGLTLLYLLRLGLAPRSTAAGLRRLVLDAAPVPAVPARPQARTPATGPPGPGRPRGRARPSRASPQAGAGSGRVAPGGTRAGRTALQDAAPARQRPGKSRTSGRRATPAYEEVEAHYAGQLAAGRVPSGKDIRAQFGVGSGKAADFHARLAAAAASARDSG